MADAISPEYLAQAEENAKKVALLEAQLAQLKAHVGLVDEPVQVSKDWPKNVYRAQDEPDPSQRDHPGWDVMLVADEVAYKAALADGWQDVPGDYAYADAKKKAAKKK